MIDKDKLRSFITLCKKGVVETPPLVEYFQDYLDSPIEDAEKFYVSKGQHNLTNHIGDAEICKWISDIMETNNWLKKHTATCNNHKGVLLRQILTKSGGTLDPHRAKAVINDFFK